MSGYTIESLLNPGASSENSGIIIGEPRKTSSFLNQLSDAEMINLVNDLERQYKYLKLENILYANFLKENEPGLLDDAYALIKFCASTEGNRTSLSLKSDHKRSMSTVRLRFGSSGNSSMPFSYFSSASTKKISYSQKMDMVAHAIDVLEVNNKIFNKKSKIAERNLKGELEEFDLREEDIKQARESFEYTVVIQGMKPLTQRIPAEKFLQFMEIWLRNITLKIEKLRYRTAHLKVQHSKVSALLDNRQELRTQVHAVDFDQLKIENGQFQETIKVKNAYYYKLKKIEGSASLVLSQHKNYIRRQEQIYIKLNKMILDKEQQVQAMEEKCFEMNAELTKVTSEYERYKALTHWSAPSVIRYARIKCELADLQKNIKKWQRRIHIQDITIHATLLEMKHITGCTAVDNTWLEASPNDID